MCTTWLWHKGSTHVGSGLLLFLVSNTTLLEWRERLPQLPQVTLSEWRERLPQLPQVTLSELRERLPQLPQVTSSSSAVLLCKFYTKASWNDLHMIIAPCCVGLAHKCLPAVSLKSSVQCPKWVIPMLLSCAHPPHECCDILHCFCRVVAACCVPCPAQTMQDAYIEHFCIVVFMWKRFEWGVASVAIFHHRQGMLWLVVVDVANSYTTHYIVCL